MTKCNGYESLFIFKSQQDMENHLAVCPECQREHEKQLQVAELVKSARPLYRKKQKNRKTTISVAAGLISLILVFFAVSPQHNQTQISSKPEMVSVHNISVITQMGLPTDDYGLLVIE